MTHAPGASASESIPQEQLLQFLGDPASYPHVPDHVEIVQTHISYVAIAPPYVYKVKKPVDLGFLDFSTPARRRHYCEQEVHLNRRMCAGVYEGVVPIVRGRTGLAFGDGEQQPVEYAVKMKHLADGYFMHQLLQQETLERTHIDRVVDKLNAFYASETPSAERAAWGRVAGLKISTDENFEQTEAYVGSLIARPAFDALRYYTNRFYDQHTLLFEHRRASGHILDCHGDLHLEHIHLAPNQICIYDCIEFNERFRTIDVANDLAFLAMDLDFNGRPDLSRYFIHQMAQTLDDPDLPRLIDFYKCYRAYVRAKVDSMRSAEPEVPTPDRQASREQARRYYQLALQYAVAGSAPLVIVVMGRVGTGKSAVAQALGNALGWPVLASDRVRKEKAGVPLYQRGTDAARARLYAPERTEATYAALRDTAVARAEAWHGTLLDATFSRHRHRDALRATLHEHRIPYCLIELTASDATLQARLRQRAMTEDEMSDARLEDFEMLAARYEAPDDLEDAFHVSVSTEQPLNDTVREALEHLIRRRVAQPGYTVHSAAPRSAPPQG